MSVEVENGVPSSFRCGTTSRWLLSYEDYPASGGALTVYFRGPTNFNVVASADGDDFSVVLTATITGQASPGVYQWEARYVETAGDTITAESGQITALPNLANTTAGTWRTRYEAASLALYNLTTGGLQSVSTEGQTFTKFDISNLQKMVDRLEMKAIEEDKRLGLAPAGNVKRIRMYF